MKIIRYKWRDKVSFGVLEEKQVKEIIFAVDGEPQLTGVVLGLPDVVILAPCQPTKIVAVGLNYHEHAKEANLEVPSSPLIFLKPPSAVIGPGEQIILPPTARRVDYEAELGVVIKRVAKNVGAKDYSNFVLGYTCFNDVSARDFQFADGQWSRAKGYDTFAPVGPWIETDVNPHDLQIEAILDGQLVQSGSTADMVFAVPQLIEYISSVMTLMPGDIIATGTPAGVGPMQPGQKIAIKIEGIGTLSNSVQRAE